MGHGSVWNSDDKPIIIVLIGLIFFVQVVERENSRQLQAKALKLLFQLQSRSHALALEFRDIGGPLMIAKVMTTDRCIVGFEVLQVCIKWNSYLIQK